MTIPSGKNSDRFIPLPIGKLYSWIKHELSTGSIFGIPRELFFQPSVDDNFRLSRFGKLLETPVGLAAGPHTQLAQNIISGWLTGARYIELKTIQDLDQIEVTKPCIDMRDEGYNCEWSQELIIDQSFSEYLKAWILIHFLKQELNPDSGEEQGFIFNMSAGYDLTGIKGEKVSGFLKKMRDSAEHKKLLIEELSEHYQDIKKLKIPDEISDNITVSTMHGTPPEEIEKIGRYFIEEEGLNTTIKLNPTLLGRDKVREIINNNLGYDVEIPDSAFEHDIEYKDALDLVRNLKDISGKRGLFFGLKLTNTLECINQGDIFPEKENMAYMSGRALHPVSVNIASKFRNDIEDIDISFSAGADAFNIADILSCNLMPVTVSSDILKPGGYGRIGQYLEKIEEAVSASKSSTIKNFIKNKSGDSKNTPVKAALINLNTYADKIVSSKEYKKDGFKKKNTKTIRKLNLFDCIKAPCTDSCGTSQDVPEYLYLTSKRKFDEAFETVIKTNSFPNTTGMVCDHQCQVKCTRSNYDNPLKIREVKRFLAENYGNNIKRAGNSTRKGMETVAIIGAGPSGLSCARYLSEAGFQVKIYEKSDSPGGMIEKVIPDFRQGDIALNKDISRITDPNIKIQYNNYIDPEELKRLSEENNFVYISTGAPESIRLDITGIDSPGVLDPLLFLSEVKSGNKVDIGKKIAVIGGGNTAIDSARTALRVAGKDAEVTILYRRTKKEMPADSAEVTSALEEGVNLIELIAPESVIHDREEKVSGLRCFRTRLGEPDSKGRRYPERIDNSGLDLMFDTIIPAVGQRPEPAIFDKGTLDLKRSGRLFRDGNIFAGGDVGPGKPTIVNAVGDGKTAAEIIIRESGITLTEINNDHDRETPLKELRLKKAVRKFGKPLKELPPEERLTASPVISTMTHDEAVAESSRCLLCDELCDICVTVCPNRANISYNGDMFSIDIPVFGKTENGIEIIGKENFSINQQNQVMNITDLCNHCGNCTTFCPTSGRPFLDKPRIAISKESFNDDNNVYLILRENKTKKIIHKKDSEKTSYHTENGLSHYSSENITLSFKMEEQDITEIKIKYNSGVLPDFKNIMTLKYLLDNIPEHLTVS